MTTNKILAQQTLNQIRNLSADARPAYKILLDSMQADLSTRTPSPLFYDEETGTIIATDLDMVSILQTLMQDNEQDVFINLPTYERTRAASSVDANQFVISRQHRHGILAGLFSNQETWSFGVRLLDQNVVKQDGSVGALRNFSLIDPRTAEWNAGVTEVQFTRGQFNVLRSSLDLEPLTLPGTNTIPVNNWVHPNRWAQMFSTHYLTCKMAIDRLKLEIKALSEVRENFENQGIKPYFSGESGNSSKQETPHLVSSNEEYVSEKVPAFEVMVESYIPFSGELPTVNLAPTSGSLGSLIKAIQEKRKLVNQFSFYTRCVEFAYYNVCIVGPEYMRYKIRNAGQIDHDYRFSGKRTAWCMVDRVDGQFRLYFRAYQKSIQVPVPSKQSAEPVPSNPNMDSVSLF